LPVVRLWWSLADGDAAGEDGTFCPRGEGQPSSIAAVAKAMSTTTLEEAVLGARLLNWPEQPLTA
jgi:hypothetical protein